MYPGAFHKAKLLVDPTIKKNVEESFKRYDEGSKGWLSRQDLKCAMASLTGYKPSKVEVENIMRGTKDEQICLQVFQRHMEEKLAMLDPDERVRRLFKAFDIRCCGFISRDDLRSVFAESLPSIPITVVDEVFDEVDADGDGRVSCREFESMLRGRITL